MHVLPITCEIGPHQLVGLVVPLWVLLHEGGTLREMEVPQDGVDVVLFPPLQKGQYHGFGLWNVVLAGPQKAPQQVHVCTQQMLHCTVDPRGWVDTGVIYPSP